MQNAKGDDLQEISDAHLHESDNNKRWTSTCAECFGVPQCISSIVSLNIGAELLDEVEHEVVQDVNE